MADNLIFPIQFDLEAAVRKAQGDADKYLRQLQTTIHSKPLAIDLKIVNAGSGSLNEISKRMRDIVSEWNNMSEAERIASKTSGEYTDRAKKLIAEFARLTGAPETYARSLQQIVAASRRAANEQEKAMEKQRKTQAILLANEKSIANITSKLKYWKEVMNSSDMGSERFRNAAEEVRRLNQSLGEAQRNVNSLTGQFRKQDGYVSRLIKRLVVYAGFQQINNFLTSVRSVTAEFELQRISLGAIIQDQAKANALFSEIKNFALKSPIKILDLAKYTKQLAAYKIGVNELFDTTKRLADISVGIGVSMDRLILLYGQVRATGYLRASEIRQATEAGIPLVEDLANKLSEVNGTLVTSAQVLKMVENRAISFEMVKEVFEDMTNAGGLFYDMQEKQGNSLYGMWQKLGDAAAMMYDEIGNTPWVDGGMREAINMLRTLMLEWKQVGATITTLGVAMALYVNKTKLATLATKLNTVANTEGLTVLRGYILHFEKAIMYQNLFATSTTAATTAAKLFTLAQLRLTQVLNLVIAGLKKLKAAFMSNIWGIALVGLSLLVEHLLLAKDTAKELKNELANINLDYESKQGQDAANLEYLANAAVNAAKGSKAQKDALEELKNTYGKIIPMELLTIENLERMKGNYGELIALIDEYNLKQKYEKEKSAIESSFAPKEEERADKIRNAAYKELELSERNIQRFLLNLHKYAEEGLDKKEMIIKASVDMAKELGLSDVDTVNLINAMLQLDRHTLEGQGTLMDYAEALYQKHEALSVVTEDYEKQKKALNEYSDVVDEVLKKNENEPEVNTNKDEFENEKARLNNQISDIASGIVELLNKANVAVDNGTQQILNTVIQNGGMIPDAVWDILEKAAEAANNPKLLAAIQGLRKHYKGLVPDNQTVIFIKDRMTQIASTMGLKMKEFRQYLWDGQGDIKTYQENLQKSINTLRAQAFEMIKLNALIDAGLSKGQKYDVKEIQTLQAKADALQQLLDTSVTPLVMPDEKNSKQSRKGGTKSDPRLQILNEMVQLAETLNKKYSEWEKKVGSTKALGKVNSIYAETVKYAEQVAKDAGIKLPHLKTPTNAKELNEYLDAVRKVMEAAKGLKGGKKAAIELAVKMSDNVSAEDQKALEAKIKELADRISRTKTAKEFYEKILSQTGDVELAANVSLQIYGSTGRELKEQVQDQFTKAFEGLKSDHADIMPKVSEIIDRGAYEELRDYISLLPGDQQKAAEDLVKAQQQMSVKQYEQWLKDLEKAKDYADKRIELSRYTANQIATIEERIAKLNPQAADYEQQRAMLEKLIAGYKSREEKEAAELEYEQFQNSALYVQVFENLDNASKTALENMRNRLIALKDQWKNLSPEKVKELTKRLEELDAQIAQRNPFKSIADSLKKLREMRKSGRTKEGDAQKAFDAEEERKAAEAKMLADEKAYEAAVKQYGAESDIAKEKRKIADDSAEAYRKAEQAADDAAETAREWEKGAEAIDNANQQIDKYQEQINEAFDGIRKIMESFGASAEDMQFFDDVVGALNEIIDAGQQAATSVGNIMSGNPLQMAQGVTQGISAIGGLVSGFSNLFHAGKVRKANKEIKRQQELLDQLEYTHGRLQNAADKLFGVDYLNNYNQQLKVLQAKQKAYLKQAQAERSKGKKADKEKIKEYENQARETADAIKELQDDLVAQIVGTDVASAARDFANAWLDAYLSFGSTTDAIKEKFDDMIKNMIVNMVLAQVVKRALEPIFKMIDDLAADGELSADDIAQVMSKVPNTMTQINDGLSVGVKALEAAGVDISKLREGSSEFSGIAKNIAGATSEEINTAAAIGNTIMYHTSHLPIISQNVAAMYQLMSQGKTSAIDSGSTGWTDWQQQAMAAYNATAKNTADMVVRCERAAVACEAMAEKMGRAFRAKGMTSGFNVFLNS